MGRAPDSSSACNSKRFSARLPCPTRKKSVLKSSPHERRPQHFSPFPAVVGVHSSSRKIPEFRRNLPSTTAPVSLSVPRTVSLPAGDETKRPHDAGSSSDTPVSVASGIRTKVLRCCSRYRVRLWAAEQEALEWQQ